MAKTSSERSNDNSKVSDGQVYQVQSEERTGSSFKKIRKAIKMQWNSRKKAENSKVIDLSYSRWQF